MREIEVEFLWEPILDAMDRGANEGMRKGADLIARTAKGIAPHRTGALINSIQPAPTEGSLSNGDLAVGVGAAATYAPYVEYGTGIYGPFKRPIVPVHAKALQIPLGGGEFIYRGSVKGMQAQPYMQPAIDQVGGKVADELGYAIEAALIEYGSSHAD